MVNFRRIPENLSGKYLLFYNSILTTVDALVNPISKTEYLQKILNDCESIIDLCVLFDQQEIDYNYIKTIKLEINNNFDWLLDKSKNGPTTRAAKIRENESYYMNADQVNSIGKEIVSTLAGLNDLKIAFKIELEKYGENVSEKGQGKDVNRIKIKSSITDIVRIFEAMKDAEIISSGKTEVKQIAEIFFSEALDKIKFEAIYNARKSEINKLQSSSTSKELERFVNIIIEECFGNKDRVLEKIIKNIERLQRNNI